MEPCSACMGEQTLPLLLLLELAPVPHCSSQKKILFYPKKLSQAALALLGVPSPP